MNAKMNVVIPMAGLGSRFSHAGYVHPKPMIDVHGKPMIQVACESLGIDANYIFIVRKEHREEYNLDDVLSKFCIPTIIEVDYTTEGAACTALLARDHIDNSLPVFFANCDQYIEWNYHLFFHAMGNADGGIVTFKDNDPKSSYALVGPDGYVKHTAEKQVISNDASVGFYYWRRGSDFVKYAEQMIEKNIRYNNEFYICPIYNEAIADGKKIKTYDVTGKVWLIGTPADLENFLGKDDASKAIAV